MNAIVVILFMLIFSLFIISIGVNFVTWRRDQEVIKLRWKELMETASEIENEHQ